LNPQITSSQTSASWTESAAVGGRLGHWEGNTLVVDTTNYSDKTAFRGSGENLHVTERFTRVDTDTIRYEFTADDPTTWKIVERGSTDAEDAGAALRARLH